MIWWYICHKWIASSYRRLSPPAFRQPQSSLQKSNTQRDSSILFFYSSWLWGAIYYFQLIVLVFWQHLYCFSSLSSLLPTHTSTKKTECFCFVYFCLRNIHTSLHNFFRRMHFMYFRILCVSRECIYRGMPNFI